MITYFRLDQKMGVPAIPRFLRKSAVNQGKDPPIAHGGSGMCYTQQAINDSPHLEAGLGIITK